MPFALLAFASCSNDEVETKAVQKSADAVNFLPAMNNATRGEIFTDAGFSNSPGKFKVIIDGNFYTADPGNGAAAGAVSTTDEVSYNTSNSAWELTNPLWWGDGTTSAKFTAYAPSDAGSASSGELTYNINTVVADQKDLVVAYNEGNRTEFSSGVPLHFRHALSQILVNASYADDANFNTNTFNTLEVKIKAVRFSNIYGTGKLTLPTASTAAGESYTPTWATSGSVTSFASADITTPSVLTSTTQSIVAASSPMLLLPQSVAATTDLTTTPTGAYLEVKANVIKKATSGDAQIYPKTEGSYDWIAVPVTIAWDGGYKYTYTLNFSNVACGKVSPNATDVPTTHSKGDDIIKGVPYPVNFLVTVEDTWQDGGTTTPAL